MTDSIWEPGEEIEGSILMCRQDVAQVGTIEDVFEGREDFNPYGRSIFARNESVGVSVRLR